MDKDRIKKIFDEIAQKNWFEKKFGMWFKEQEESLIALDLQKSNFSPIYYVNINVYIQGLWGKTFIKNKDLKHGGSDAAIFRRMPDKYNDAFNLENALSEEQRKVQLEQAFFDFLMPFIQKTSTKAKIIENYNEKDFMLIPKVREELGIKN